MDQARLQIIRELAANAVTTKDLQRVLDHLNTEVNLLLIDHAAYAGGFPTEEMRDLIWIAVMGILRQRAGNWGEFVHHNRKWDDSEFTLIHGCPDCGCPSWIAFCHNDGEWKRRSSPFDLFECVLCGTTTTRRDNYGWKEWGVQNPEDDQKRK